MGWIYEPPKTLCKIPRMPAAFCGLTAFTVFSKGANPKGKELTQRGVCLSTTSCSFLPFSLVTVPETSPSPHLHSVPAESHTFQLLSKTSSHQWSPASMPHHSGEPANPPHTCFPTGSLGRHTASPGTEMKTLNHTHGRWQWELKTFWSPLGS